MLERFKRNEWVIFARIRIVVVGFEASIMDCIALVKISDRAHQMKIACIDGPDRDCV